MSGLGSSGWKVPLVDVISRPLREKKREIKKEDTIVEKIEGEG